MSVVVVVVGAGTVVCCVVVVELCVALSVSQPVSDKRAAVAKQAMTSFFISIIMFGLLLYKREITLPVDHRLWGVTLPNSLRRDFAAHPLAGLIFVWVGMPAFFQAGFAFLPLARQRSSERQSAHYSGDGTGSRRLLR